MPVDRPHRNPYGPPKAAVRDVTTHLHPDSEDSGSGRGRPLPVTLAAAFLWTSLALGAASVAADWKRMAPQASLAVGLPLTLGIFGIFSWITLQIARGRKWARTTFILLTTLSALIWGARWRLVMMISAIYPLTVAMAAAQLLLQLAAVCLLLTTASRRWFVRA